MKLTEIRYIPKDKKLNEPDPHKHDIKLALRSAMLIGRDPEIVFNSDQSVSIKGGISFKDLEWRHLPEILRFKEIQDDFVLKDCKINTWEGTPRYVGGALRVSNCRFEDMRGSPESVDGDISITRCRLKSLRGFSDMPITNLDLSDNDLTNIKGCPEIIDGDLILNGNMIQTFEGFPGSIEGELSMLRDYHLKSFEGISKYVHDCARILASDSDIESHVLGLLEIEHLQFVEFKPKAVCDIVNKHLAEHDNKGDLFACQQELIESGFEEYAQV